tara:strand:+ start:391 stop:876 length:486 start_codon:yes stop_codon:yes gene_type:complete
MNRRNFIKKASIMGALTTWTVTCKFQENKKVEEKEASQVDNNYYVVYCYERNQEEWVFDKNIKGSFDETNSYIYPPIFGERWINGRLSFSSFKNAEDFIEVHHKCKNDSNIVDSIYEVYEVSKDSYYLGTGEPATQVLKEKKKIAEYWYNNDTGRTIFWKT